MLVIKFMILFQSINFHAITTFDKFLPPNLGFPILFRIINFVILKFKRWFILILIWLLHFLIV